ncbi:MAG: 3-dehydroquinate synthase II [Planctomycetota bacterium]
MKSVWVNADPWSRDVVTAALESGADAVVVPEGYTDRAHALGRIKTVAPDGDIVLGEHAVLVEVDSKSDEQRVAKMPADQVAVLRMRDWKVIPIENLIAERGNLFVEVSNAKEAKLMAETLEKGVDGVLLRSQDISEIKETVAAVKEISTELPLLTAKVTAVEQLGMGDRVCVDTCSEMKPGEGMLVGNSSDAFLLVHSETIESPYVATRPFRVNAGALHAYLLVPDGRTKYLSDLRAGDPVMIVNSRGETQQAYVGRCKVERRPLLLIRAEVGDEETGTRRIGLVMQNAETVRVTQPNGDALSVAEAKPGDEVLACLTEGGRHFGMKVEETLTER